VVSRRALLGGGVASLGLVAASGIGLIGSGLLPGESRVRKVLGACDVSAPEPRSAAGELVSGAFGSTKRQAEVRYRIAYPPGARTTDPLPVCLVLHGLGGDERVIGPEIALPGYLADLVDAGAPPFVLAAADGGPRFWHPRANGDDPLGMLTEEFLPLLAGRGLNAGAGQRIGLLGYSMGGYGALLFAEQYPTLVGACAVGGPAIWTSYQRAHQYSPGAFDSAADWNRNNVLARGAALEGVPVRIDVGRDDPFVGNIPVLRASLPAGVEIQTAPGCHDATFWRSSAPAALRFVSQAFTTVS
jgi:enterochelin esterase-like enzyme